MALSAELQTFDARLATFETPQQINKRRASNNRKRQPNTVSWPHEKPDPEQLAKAGFYYKPSSSSNDSVTCFLCNKALDGWDTGDNPALEHLNHVPHCGWAINCCIEQRSNDMDRVEEDPLSEQMIESRRATFRDWWPHEGKKGWKCKVQKMVDAGWCYSPLPEADDCVTCFYCCISLDGWEPKDDPWQEHQKRAPQCHFFTLVEESAQQKKAAKPKKGKTSRALKASHQPAQSTADAEADPLTIPSEEEPATEEGDSLMSTASTASRTGKSRKKTTTSRTSSRAKKKATRTASDTFNESALDQQIENKLVRELDEPEDDTPEAEKPTRPVKNKRRVKNGPSTGQSVVAETQAGSEPTNAKAAKGVGKGRKKKVTAGTDVPDEPPPSSESASTADVKNEKPKRGRKRLSDGSEKQDGSVVVLIEMPQPEHRAEESTSRQTPDLDETQPDIGENENNDDKSKKSENALQKKPKKDQTRKKQIQASAPTSDVEEPTSPALPVSPTPSRQSSPPPVYQDAQGEEDEADTQPQQPSQQPTPPPATRDALDSSPTAQSSDAENQPPSSNPASSKRPPNPQPQPSQTPRTSPSKRNMVALDTLSGNGWHPIDLDGIFMASPSHAHLASKGEFNVETIIQTLTSPEKRLTVEEWIRKNAGEAEERLRLECERMIGKFEEEGNRALTAVEGVECV